MCEGKNWNSKGLGESWRISCLHIWEQWIVFSGYFIVQEGFCLSPLLLVETLTHCLPCPCSDPSQNRGVTTAWDVHHILSSYLLLVNMRRTSGEGFEDLICFLFFLSWSMASKPAYEKDFTCVTKKLAAWSWQFIGIQEEVDFLLYKHIRIRLQK